MALLHNWFAVIHNLVHEIVKQREIEEDYRKRALESARLDTYEDPRNRHD